MIWILCHLIFVGCTMQGHQFSNAIKLHQRADLLFVTLKVNDKKAIFLVDTGASKSLIDQNQTQRYQFTLINELGSGTVRGLGGQEQLRPIQDITVTHQQIKLRGLKFYATDLNPINRHLEQYGFSILGVVGADFLNRNQATISYSDHTVTLKAKK